MNWTVRANLLAGTNVQLADDILDQNAVSVQALLTECGISDSEYIKGNIIGYILIAIVSNDDGL